MGALGLEPRTYALKGRLPEFLSTLESKVYSSPENHLTVNLTKNPAKIQQDLAKIINRWASLPQSIQTAIMVLIGGDK